MGNCMSVSGGATTTGSPPCRITTTHDYREYASGAGWKVWVSLPGNPAVQQAEPHAALPVPCVSKPEAIDDPDAWLHQLTGGHSQGHPAVATAHAADGYRPLAALPEAFAPWESGEPYPTPSCGACPAPAAGALRRASPCAGTRRRVRLPHTRHPGRGAAAGGCQGARSRAGGAKVLLNFLSASPITGFPW